MAHLAPHTPDPGPEPSGRRLDSWKEIAVYLRRDVRTVQRWEKSEGLPVRRHQHDSQGSIYAYRHELDAWREARQLQLTNDRLPKLLALATDGPHVYVSEMTGDRWLVSAIPVAGGDPAPAPIPLSAPVLLDVSPDGTEMLALDLSAWTLQGGIREYPLYRVPAGGGTPTRVGDLMTHCASWFPDGRRILFLSGHTVNVADRDGISARALVALSRAEAPPVLSATRTGRTRP